MATLNDVLATRINALAAVTALTPRIRPDKLAQTDTLPAVLIQIDNKTPHNDLSGVGGLATALARVRSVAETRAAADALAEAIRINGTNPGTGLAGWRDLTAALPVQSSMLDHYEYDYVPYEDGSDNGFFVTDSIYQVDYTETT